MDLDDIDLRPVGGGSLRNFVAPATTSGSVATFTQTQTIHPDSIWRPLGGEFDQGRAIRQLPSAQGPGETGQQGDARPGHLHLGIDPGDGYNFQDTARLVRSALTGGS